jgi:hypothetical protein
MMQARMEGLDGQSDPVWIRPDPASSRFELELLTSRERFWEVGQRVRLPSMSSGHRYDGDRSC